MITLDLLTKLNGRLAKLSVYDGRSSGLGKDEDKALKIELDQE